MPDSTPASDASPAPDADDADACLNCGAPIHGPYCARCGQRHMPSVRPLRAVLAEWLEEVASLDSRVLRTVGLLCFRPGRLTAEHNAGRRIRFVPPIRLYMVASVAFFFVLTLTPDEWEPSAGTAGGPAAVASVDEATPDDAPSPGAAAGSDAPAATGDGDTAATTDTDETDSWFQARMAEQGERIAEDPFGFLRFSIRVLAWSMFVLLPLAALLLVPLYRRPKRYYVEHLVFTLHVHAFTFLVLAAAVGVMHVAPYGAVSGGVLLFASLLIPTYVFLALLRTYREGLVRTTLKFGVLTTGYAFALSVVVTASSMLALTLF